MTMKKILPFLTALIIGLSLSMQPAEAKRMGSGSSMGQQKQGFAREATPPSAPTGTAASATSRQAAAPAAAAPAASGMSNWMGPLAGLAAGGLLAAMFFGGAFEGIQIMDILLIALLAFGVFMIIRMMRAKQAPQHAQGQQQYATVGAPYEAAPQPEQMPMGGFDHTRTALHDMPAWFDEHSFLQGARTHFMTLQMAWDANDLNKLREYFTPELFQQLRAQRAEIGDASNVTDVQSLDAQLLDLVREGDLIVASVLFQGRVREDDNLPEDIAEIWHVQHAADTAQGDWLISGIQQAEPKNLH